MVHDGPPPDDNDRRLVRGNGNANGWPQSAAHFTLRGRSATRMGKIPQGAETGDGEMYAFAAGAPRPRLVPALGRA